MNAIVRYPDPVLEQAARPVEDFAECDGLARDMIRLMRKARGIGLAAPQIGVSLRLIVVEVPGRKVFAMANPEIVEREGREIGVEGCLSLPGRTGNVERAARIRVVGRRTDGQEMAVKASGLLARALQHEIDHLDGVLFIRKTA